MLVKVKSLEEIKNMQNVFKSGMHYVCKDESWIFMPDMHCNCNKIIELTEANTHNGRMYSPWMCSEWDIENVEYTGIGKIDKHKLICEELNEIYKCKNHDYGDSFGETYKKLGLISAVTRITDKVNRLQSLCTKENMVDESIKDTLLDAANYCIMTLIELDNK